MLPEMMTFIRLLREQKAEAIVISDDGAARPWAPRRAAAGVFQWLSPLATMPGQLLALYLAYARLRSRPAWAAQGDLSPDFLCRPFSVPAVVQEVQVRLIGECAVCALELAMKSAGANSIWACQRQRPSRVGRMLQPLASSSTTNPLFVGASALMPPVSRPVSFSASSCRPSSPSSRQTLARLFQISVLGQE